MKNNVNYAYLKKELPHLEQQINRFEYINQRNQDFNVVVYGKYNHGKSSLLNALLCKEDYFKAEDKRTTTENATYVDSNTGATWIDTPGLAADVAGEDDDHANSAVTKEADLILFVHNVKVGELDREEMEYLTQLLQFKKPSQIILVLTQQDQLKSDQFEQVFDNISQQVESLNLIKISVSQTRYFKGIKNNSSNMQQRSNIDELKKMIHQKLADFNQIKSDEYKDLQTQILTSLENKSVEISTKKLHKIEELNNIHLNFQTDVQKLIQKIQQQF